MVCVGGKGRREMSVMSLEDQWWMTHSSIVLSMYMYACMYVHMLYVCMSACTYLSTIMCVHVVIYLSSLPALSTYQHPPSPPPNYVHLLTQCSYVCNSVLPSIEVLKAFIAEVLSGTEMVPSWRVPFSCTPRETQWGKSWANTAELQQSEASQVYLMSAH